MKIFARHAVILIHTSENIIRVEGVFWIKGYPSTRNQMSMSTISTLQLNTTDTCHFTIFVYPQIILVCIDSEEIATIMEYTLNSNKELILERKLSTYEFRIFKSQLQSSWSDNIFFYQPGYHVNS